MVVREGATGPSGFGRFAEPLARFAIGSGPAGITGPDEADSGELAGAPGFGPVGAGIAAGVGGAAGSGEWPAVAASTAEQEVAAARSPRFAPPEQELGPQRVADIGQYPGRFGGASTGPIPAVEPDPAEAEPAAYAGEYGQSFAGAGDAQPAAGGMFGTGPSPVFGAEHPSVPSVPPPAAGNEWSAPTAAATGEHQSQPAAWGSDQLSQPAAAWPGEQSERTVAGASGPGLGGSGSSFRSEDSGYRLSNGGVIVPPAASLGEENRLPIFEAVESDWFRRGRPSVDVSGQAGLGPSRTWTSPSDEGWKVAEAAVAPTSGGTTVAGLPRRVPKANLIPGTAAETTTPAPVRSASATRERFASLQRGVREARSSSSTEKGDGTDDVPGDG